MSLGRKFMPLADEQIPPINLGKKLWCVCHVAYKSGLYPDFLSQYRELVSPFIPSMSKLVRTLCSDSLLMLKHLHYSQYIVVVCCRMQDDTIKID